MPDVLSLLPVHVAWVKLVNPFIWLLDFVANSLLRLVKVQPKDELETAYTSAELAELLSESRREGLLDQSEHERLSQTLSSVQKTVGDVLVETLVAFGVSRVDEAAVARFALS